MKYDIFISYRRKEGYETAKHLFDLLTIDGYRVSFDLDTLRSGDFDTELLTRIDQCTDFILILDANAFERTLDSNFPKNKDWLRCELSYALQKKKNIIPVFLSGFSGFPDGLPDDVADVTRKHGPQYNQYYFDDFYRRLKQDFLQTKSRNKRSIQLSYKTIAFAIPVALLFLCILWGISKYLSSSYYGANIENKPITEVIDSSGYVFVAKTKEGVDVTYKVISMVDKTVQVGNGKSGFSNGTKGRAIDKSYNEQITIPEMINGFKVIKIACNAFYECDISSIVLPNTITHIGECAFCSCRKLENISFPLSLTTIENEAFHDTRLSRIEIPQNVSHISNYAFSHGMQYVDKIVVDSNNIYYDSRNNCNAIIETSTNKLLVGCLNTKIPETVSVIGCSAFYSCNRLTNIVIPSNIKRIEVAAFWKCENLSNIVLTNGLEAIESSAFANTSITSISIPPSVSMIGERPFGGCRQLHTIKVSANNKTYDSRNNCNAVIKTSTNTIIDGCNNTIIPANVTGIAHNAFHDCNISKIISWIDSPFEFEHAFLGLSEKAVLYVPKGTKEKYKNTKGWDRFENIIEMEQE